MSISKEPVCAPTFNLLSHLDPLRVFDRRLEETHCLRNLLAGKPSYLVCGGPSTKNQPMHLLKQRGVFTLAVNNMAGNFWSNAFVCSDPPSKFHHGIWLDPTMMKFVPITKFRGYRANLRQKVGEEFSPLLRDGQTMTVPDCPNVWGFGRRAWLQPDDTFFTDPDASWGNHQAGVDRTGEKKTVNTTLLGVRLLYYLGSRIIFLVGCDFRMDPKAPLTENYSFAQDRDESAINSNNSQFLISGEWLQRMQNNGTFSKFGLRIFNTFEKSGLRAFPFVPFEQSVEITLKDFPKQPFNLSDWYKK